MANREIRRRLIQFTASVCRTDARSRTARDSICYRKPGGLTTGIEGMGTAGVITQSRRTMLGRSAIGLAGAACLLSGVLLAGEQPSHEYMTTSDGVKIHYMVQGQGSPVIMIHGFGATADWNWFSNGIAEALAKKHRVIAID